ncbi:hypothetical protein E2C01_097798 [Portunus trituberculatus]|uniref:Uncharacterized protein n=1 Tax=Portunus trituberculatus TaxID=210409 RepID=A0A5B7KB05_PORTR|nr:hypothetical protein [Portunus trituberculatus]
MKDTWTCGLCLCQCWVALNRSHVREEDLCRLSGLLLREIAPPKGSRNLPGHWSSLQGDAGYKSSRVMNWRVEDDGHLSNSVFSLSPSLACGEAQSGSVCEA